MDQLIISNIILVAYNILSLIVVEFKHAKELVNLPKVYIWNICSSLLDISAWILRMQEKIMEEENKHLNLILVLIILPIFSSSMSAHECQCMNRMISIKYSCCM